MDFVTFLPETSSRSNAIITIVDRFSKCVRFIHCTGDIDAILTAVRFFHHWVYHSVCRRRLSLIGTHDLLPNFVVSSWNYSSVRLGKVLHIIYRQICKVRSFLVRSSKYYIAMSATTKMLGILLLHSVSLL